ncbi:MAG: DNA polymerase/3'-5' exonuclease PolX [Gemmatimonadales bacterium]|nr:DNA polymerase/3'-5' exonuclease PolX [Gemmatimonadales bacterium]
MDRTAVARVLDQIASYLELKGENPFRVRAFHAASKAVAGLAAEPADALADGSLAATKGVGQGTIAIVEELVRVGRSELLEQLREDVPAGLVEMLGISGLGVSRIRTIHEKLGIESLTELETAAREGKLAALPGFGAKTAENVLKGIAFLRRAQEFRLSHHALEEAELLRAALERLPGVDRALVAGEVRRRCEVVRELVLVLVADVPAADVFRSLALVPGVEEVAGADERRVTLRTPGGMSARIVVTPPVNLGAVFVQATGSEAHLAQLSDHAVEKGFSLNAVALWHGSEFVPTPDEAALYRALGLREVPPELREGTGEVTRAASGPFPRLLEPADLTGFLHCHSSYSDGAVGIEEMAVACREAGYAYMGLTDHSKAAAYAGGLSVDDLHRQWAEIDAVNARLSGIVVLKGIESDILADGSLDYDDATLAGFDFVIASIHSRFAMTEDEMTARVLRAMESPYLTILGHPTGRLLLSRQAYPLDLDRVFAKAAQAKIAIEINADPHRLDLDWRVLRRARDRGVMISIGSDAHNRAGIGNMAFGVGIARKGGLTREDILNCRPANEFLTFARARRPR